MFGLELQALLRKAKPRCSLDDEYFLGDLFSHFVEGLRDDDHRRVACDAWKPSESSLMDLFNAIDNYETKRRLLNIKVPNRVASFVVEEQVYAYVDEGEGNEKEEEEVLSAANFKGSGGFKNRSKFTNGTKPVTSNSENKIFDKNPQGGQKDNTSAPTTKRQDSGDREGLITEIMDRMSKVFEKQRPERRENPNDEDRCYRCQEMGHRSYDCTAEKPVTRYQAQEMKREREKKEKEGVKETGN